MKIVIFIILGSGIFHLLARKAGSEEVVRECIWCWLERWRKERVK